MYGRKNADDDNDGCNDNYYDNFYENYDKNDQKNIQLNKGFWVNIYQIWGLIHGQKKVQKFGQGPPPTLSGNARKKTFFFGGLP